MPSLNYEIVSIEGNIGSGKSTLMKHLKDHFKNNDHVMFLKEPVDEWEKIKDNNGKTILEKFYGDPEKYSFSFQIMAYISRLNVLREALKNINPLSNKKYIIITERSLYTDKLVFAKMLYETGKMEDVNYQIYSTWFKTFSEEFPVHRVIYVKTLPEICYQRISSRSREGEENISLDYLTSCYKYHEDMMSFFSNNIVSSDKQLILDGNINIYQNTHQMEDWIFAVNWFIRANIVYNDVPNLISDADSATDTDTDIPELISDTESNTDTDNDMPELIEVD
jgi:deoxyadenosine/deoxycytidine kinase